MCVCVYSGVCLQWCVCVSAVVCVCVSAVMCVCVSVPRLQEETWLLAWCSPPLACLCLSPPLLLSSRLHARAHTHTHTHTHSTHTHLSDKSVSYLTVFLALGSQ